MIAFVHVMNRLLDRKDTFAIHKLNDLLELSVKRYETFSKTTEQVFNMDDLYLALDYQHQVKNDESREMNFEEAVLECMLLLTSSHWKTARPKYLSRGWSLTRHAAKHRSWNLHLGSH